MGETAFKLHKMRKDALIRWEYIKSATPKIFSLWYAKYCYKCRWLKTCESH